MHNLLIIIVAMTLSACSTTLPAPREPAVTDMPRPSPPVIYQYIDMLEGVQN